MRLRGARGVALLVTTVTLIVITVYVVGFSPVLALERVVVSGAPDEVAQTAVGNADAPIGLPLARVDTSELTEAVLADSRIEQVDVSRNWPSSIEIEVTVRTPVAVLAQGGHQRYLVDAQGIAYEKVAQAPSGLPVVSAPGGDVSPASLRGAVAARQAIADPWSGDVSSVKVTADGDIRFRVGEIDVHWGPPTEAKAKAAALGALLVQEPIDPEADEPLTIDVTAPATPVVTGLPTVP
ncbi:MAG: FtsQ-type POTRA domain-containing protein [Ornithinimicrobium sp.]